MIIIS